MTTKRTLTVTLPNGETATRVTARIYTHAIVSMGRNGGWEVDNWCGSLDLARKQLTHAQRRIAKFEPRMVPVNA